MGCSANWSSVGVRGVEVCTARYLLYDTTNVKQFDGDTGEPRDRHLSVILVASTLFRASAFALDAMLSSSPDGEQN